MSVTALGAACLPCGDVQPYSWVVSGRSLRTEVTEKMICKLRLAGIPETIPGESWREKGATRTARKIGHPVSGFKTLMHSTRLPPWLVNDGYILWNLHFYTVLIFLEYLSVPPIADHAVSYKLPQIIYCFFLLQMRLLLFLMGVIILIWTLLQASAFWGKSVVESLQMQIRKGQSGKFYSYQQ